MTDTAGFVIDAKDLHYKDLNSQIKSSISNDVHVVNALGHRYIGCGTSGKNITIDGVPGNAMGAYLNGSRLIVTGNAQDAVGDTMNSGEIIIHGNCGDTTGYGMRSGSIFIKGSVGYRVGIHMKEYKEFRPVVVIGERAGDFLGEYQAGGLIVVLGLNGDSGKLPIGGFPATGMHGGKIFIRTNAPIESLILPAQIICGVATDEDREDFGGYIRQFCENFGVPDSEKLISDRYLKLSPDSHNPYKAFYVNN